MIKVYTYICLVLFPLFSISQEIDKGGVDVLLPRSYQFGLNFNTIGWGVTFDYAKQKNVNYKTTFGVVLTNVRNQKEFKIVGTSGSRGYYLGKVNSLVAIRPTIGGDYRLFKARRENGIEIQFKWKIGPSFGFLKPVYLEIDKGSNNDKIQVSERYNPDIHYTGIVYSSSKWFKGIKDGRFKTGLFAKSGVDFNFSTNKRSITGGEIGVMADIYPFNEIELLYKQTEQKLFVSLYLQFNLGKKY